MHGSRAVLTTAVCGILLLAQATVPAAPEPIRAPAAPKVVATDEQILLAARVGTDGPALIDFIRKHTLPEGDAGKVRILIRQLGDNDFLTRERATAGLVRLRTLAVPFLRQAARDPDPEVAWRAQECLGRIGPSYEPEVHAAAVRLLAVRKPPEAAAALLAYLPFAATNTVTDAVQAALTALAVQDGRPEKALVAGLEEKLPEKRVAAALALHHGGASDARPAVRKLLQDPDTSVRLRVGLALAYAKDREAVPALIEVLATASLPDAWQAEDVLFRLAEGKAPAAVLGTEPADRKKCRDAWADWWAKHGKQADLGKLEAATRLKGFTMLVLLELGRVREVDATNKTIWELEGIQFPLDAQLLPDDHLLLAEYKGNRVTERDRKGEVVWEHKTLNTGPLAAQRLANGNTFIVTEAQLLEVDPKGKAVSTHARADGEGFRKGIKLRNGDMAYVTTDGRFIRVNPAGKEVTNFPVDVSTNGGRLDVLPNGHVLIPQMQSNKVIEYDTLGKPVWEVSVEEPIAAVRLPNGHTLVTSLNAHRAVEFNRAGREVWEFKGNTRVTRAFRR
jgi:hypothetical protein